jgi:RimJ/RimL family protein N-acetyltransferase
LGTDASEDATGESPSGPSDSLPEDPIGREGRTVRLREATLANAPVLDARDADPATVGEFNDLGQPTPRPLADQLANGKRMVSPERGSMLVERIDDGAVIGSVSWHPVMYGPNEQSRALNIGVALYPDARGHGFGTEAQRLLAELLLEQFAIERVEASTDVDNIAEQRSLDKAGFTREGVIRRAQYRAGGYHDLVGYSFVREDIERRRGG